MSFSKLTKRITILAGLIFLMAACNDDFNEIGSSIVDSGNFEALYYGHAKLNAKSEKFNRIKSNNLSAYALGVYDDPMYGKSTANVLTQVALSRENPNFGTEPELDSVVIAIPYFSTIKSQNSFEKKYDLDSVFGNGTVKLSVYRSNYFLRDFDPSNNYEPQMYYTDDSQKFEDHLESTPLYVNNSFKPSKKEVVLTTPKRNPEGNEQDTTKMSPQLRIKLPVEYFEQAILEKEGSDQLMTNANFIDYFRGIYLKTEQLQDAGFFGILDFRSNDAGIYLYYKNERLSNNTDEDEDEEISYNYNSFKLNFARQTVNVFETDYLQLPAAEDNLYVKGGQGSMAVIDLFTDENQLDSLRNTGWMVNEANLKFYINKDAMPSQQKNPERLLVYDVNNKRMLKDYSVASGIRENDVLNSRLVHLGRMENDEHGTYYKMRITNYIHDIINNDSTNTRLGLVVSQNVNNDNMANVETPEQNISKAPLSTVLARNGTVLYGPEAPQGKALKLEIYYTKPK